MSLFSNFFNSVQIGIIFIPESYLIFCIMVQFFLNNYYTIRFNLPFSNLTLFIQTFFILTCTFYLYFILSDLSLLAILNVDDNIMNFFLFGNKMELFIVFFALLLLIPFAFAYDVQKCNYPEYYSVFLLMVLTSVLICKSDNLFIIYLLLETQALLLYLAASFQFLSTFTIEANKKYFIFGSIISGLLLFILSLLYGFFGSLDFGDISLIMQFLDTTEGTNYYVLNLLLALVTILLFKLGLSCIPFWPADIYDGTSVIATLTLSILPKIPLFYVLTRLSLLFGSYFCQLQLFFFLFGLVILVSGTLLALQQARLKRFIIYSSLGQAGFPVVILGLSNDAIAIPLLFFFLFYYIFGVLLMWSLYLLYYQQLGWRHLEYQAKISEGIVLSDIQNFYYLQPVLTFVFCISLFLFSGLPPFYSFIYKFVIVTQLMVYGHYLISIMLIVFAVGSLYFYMRILTVICFEYSIVSLYREKFISFLPLNFLAFATYTFIFVCLFFLLSSIFFFDIILQFVFDTISFAGIVLPIEKGA